MLSYQVIVVFIFKCANADDNLKKRQIEGRPSRNQEIEEKEREATEKVNEIKKIEQKKQKGQGMTSNNRKSK